MKRQPLDLTQHLQAIEKRKKRNLQTLLLLPFITLIIATPLAIWGALFASGQIAFLGIPASVVRKVIGDPIALNAFMDRDGRRLHARLENLDVEEDIKNYHRPHIGDEVKLDVYIHQLMYNWTGYIGQNYRLNSEGLLVLTRSGYNRLTQEIDQKTP